MKNVTTSLAKKIGAYVLLLTILILSCNLATISIAAEPDETLEDHITDLIVPDGIYAFMNVASQKWMDIRFDSIYPGYNMQQYAYSATPADGNAPYGLYRVTQIESTGRYVIRPLLNEELSFEYVGAEIKTQEIPALDRDVAAEDTYEIEYHGNGQYTLRQHGKNAYVCCGDLDASGSAAGSRSFLTTIASSNVQVARWILQPYQEMLKTGVYWISNDTGIANGSNPRIMDAEGPSYAEGTPIQQWKSPDPDPIMYNPQIWIVRNIGCGYYTISHSQKFDMYMSYNGSSVTLKECKDSAIGNDTAIQWKIEGNTQNGYRITSKADSSKCITAPNSTTNGQNLIYSAPSATNSLSHWDFKRLEDVYIMSILTAYNTSSSINDEGEESGQAFMDFGHAWVKFENMSLSEVTIGSAKVGPNEYITVGGWGNQEPDQMWYNLERYFASNMSTDKYGRYISVLIRGSKLSVASNYIINHQVQDWSIIFQNNCVHFATALWEAIGKTEFNNITGTPKALYNAMGSNPLCVDGIVSTPGEWQGYYLSWRLHKVGSDEIENIPTSGANAQGLQIDDSAFAANTDLNVKFVEQSTHITDIETEAILVDEPFEHTTQAQEDFTRD